MLGLKAEEFVVYCNQVAVDSDNESREVDDPWNRQAGR